MSLQWTPDCQGKWDYDGAIVSVSSRYWPRGGGSWVLVDGVEQPPNLDIKPSASSTIYVGEDCAIKAEFEGESEAEVKAQVERWVEAKLDIIRTAVKVALEES